MPKFKRKLMLDEDRSAYQLDHVQARARERYALALERSDYDKLNTLAKRARSTMQNNGDPRWQNALQSEDNGEGESSNKSRFRKLSLGKQANTNIVKRFEWEEGVVTYLVKDGLLEIYGICLSGTEWMLVCVFDPSVGLVTTLLPPDCQSKLVNK